MPILTLKFKETVIEEYHLKKGQSFTIGRRSSNDAVIENLAVSGHHARIDSMGDGFVLTDLQSKNGSFVNEQMVSSHWLKEGDVISIGKHSLAFHYGADEARPDDVSAEMDQTLVMDTDRYRAMLAKSGAGSAPKAAPTEKPIGKLTFLNGGRGEFTLNKKLIKIGKDSSADVRLKGFWIGRTAATISLRPSGFYLSYVGGFAKPRVNDQTVSRSIRLKDFDIIEIASSKMQFFTQS